MNFDQYKNKKIYFIGIGGISMYAIALLLKNKGAYVYGYDRARSETTETLEKNGIKVYYETSAKNSVGADFCVTTAAVGSGNAEYDNVYNNNIPIYTRGKVLGDIINCFSNSIGVSGTHGKSTTTGMLSQIYLAAEEQYNPTIMMGAVLPQINSAFNLGGSDNLIFEACEYKDSFLSFKPTIAVILNVRLDHTDYFTDIDMMKNSFCKYASGAKKVVVNYDSADALDAVLKSNKEFITFSIDNEKADYYAQNISFGQTETRYSLFHNKTLVSEFEISVPGEHNLSNALAATVAALVADIPIEIIKKGLKNFKGIKRRMEFLGRVNGAVIYDDYAHHPDEINSTLSAIEKMNFENTVCLFQPHTYTRLSFFFDEFASAFKRSIKCILLPTYAARETNNLGFDSEKLAEAIPGSIFINSNEKAAQYIMDNAKENELYILMGAGDVTNISKYLKFD